MIGVLDSGFSAHPDLVNNLHINKLEICDDGIDNDNNGYVDDCYGYVGL